MQTLRVRQVPWSNPVGRGLREALRAEAGRGPAPSAAEGSEDDGGAGVVVFLIVYELASGQPVGCGGLSACADGSAAVEHLYVLPYARWSGVSSSITEELAAWAVAHGIAVSGVGDPARPAALRL